MKALQLFALGLAGLRSLPGEYGALSYRIGWSLSQAIYLALPYAVAFAAGAAICAIF